jgi:hypothetical protein
MKREGLAYGPARAGANRRRGPAASDLRKNPESNSGEIRKTRHAASDKDVDPQEASAIGVDQCTCSRKFAKW